MPYASGMSPMDGSYRPAIPVSISFTGVEYRNAYRVLLTRSTAGTGSCSRRQPASFSRVNTYVDWGTGHPLILLESSR